MKFKVGDIIYIPGAEEFRTEFITSIGINCSRRGVFLNYYGHPRESWGATKGTKIRIYTDIFHSNEQETS